jgi:hypothetical protein
VIVLLADGHVDETPAGAGSAGVLEDVGDG